MKKLVLGWAVLFCVASVMPFSGSLAPVLADSVTASVTVGNTAPVLSGNVAESLASTTASPTNVGSNVTFQGTANDSNSENFYLAVCRTNSITPNNGGAPTCAVSQELCISNATASGAQASCNYTTLQADTESNDWYAFVCDGNATSAACSAVNSGTGDSGSPFAVNHAPGFTAISNNGPINPGDIVTWSATASDTDTSGAQDQVKLLVCATAGISAGACTGTELCSSALSNNNPTCGYDTTAPVTDGLKDGYAYIVDTHNFGSTSGNQGSNSSYTVDNVSPSVLSVSLNGGSDFTPNVNSTKSFTVQAVIQDNNSCAGGEISTVTSNLYRSLITNTACDAGGEANGNNCYPVISCSVVSSGNTCDGTSDASAAYDCTVSVSHYMDPTDLNTPYTAQTWWATANVTDDDAASASLENSTGIEVTSVVAQTVTATIAYGSKNVGDKDDPLNKQMTVTATGNVGLDNDLSGVNMTSGPNEIAVGYQHYATTGVAYASGTSLTTSPVQLETNVVKTTTGANASGLIYWGIEIPTGTLPGSYSGTDTVDAAKSESGEWGV